MLWTWGVQCEDRFNILLLYFSFFVKNQWDMLNNNNRQKHNSSGISSMRSFITHTSINSIEDPVYESPTTFLKQISKKLQQASQWLSYHEFKELLFRTIRKCIKKAQVDTSFTDAIDYIKRWISLYSYDLEIMARVLILESLLMSKEMPNQALEKLKKVKHLLIQSDVDYLMVKVFVVESRVYQVMNDKDNKLKVLKKCVEYGQNYSLEYLKQTNQIRLELADNMIIAYYQIFKILKQLKPNIAIEHLSKAYQAAIKNYGSQHFSTVNLAQVLNQQRNILVNIEKLLPKALSEVQVVGYKKNMLVSILYSWEEELLVVQLDKIKGNQKKSVAQATLGIKLDMQRIKILKNKTFTEWIQISGSQLRILEQNIRKITQVEQQPQKNNTINYTLKQLDKGDIIKKIHTEEDESSSSDDEGIAIPDSYRFIKFYPSRSNLSRSKSRERTRDNNYSARN